MNCVSEIDKSLFEVLAECKVKTFKRGSYFRQVCHAYPMEKVPEIMKNWSEAGWQNDHWEFPDEQFSGGACSVYSTWVQTNADIWRESVCILQLQRRGFVFVKYDPSLFELGSGI